MLCCESWILAVSISGTTTAGFSLKERPKDIPCNAKLSSAFNFDLRGESLLALTVGGEDERVGDNGGPFAREAGDISGDGGRSEGGLGSGLVSADALFEAKSLLFPTESTSFTPFPAIVVGCCFFEAVNCGSLELSTLLLSTEECLLCDCVSDIITSTT